MGEWVDYDLIPRKHADPVRRLILRHQTDITGHSWEEYADLLFVGDPADLGLLAKAAPWVIYKRNTTGDWSQFSEVFGMHIQEYIYDSDDEESRQRAMEDAANAGSLAQFFHAKDTEFRLTEAGNKTGSADVYERLCERCNNEISKLILGNTLTTEAADKGTQALGTVHKKVEDKITQADKEYVLNVLNYELTDIFAAIGIDTAGGTFCFPEKKDIDPTTKVDIITKLKTGFNLPMSDDYLYNEFGIEKPADYAKIKRQQQREQEQYRRLFQTHADPSGTQGTDGTAPDNKTNTADTQFIAYPPRSGATLPRHKVSFIRTLFKNLRDFFGPARRKAGDTALKW